MAAPRPKTPRPASLTDIPNIGASVAGDLRRLGITSPAQLARHEPMSLYRRLARLDGVAHDPCLLDTFMAAIDYLSGAPARPWWKYTPRRKQLFTPAQLKAAATRSKPKKGTA